MLFRSIHNINGNADRLRVTRGSRIDDALRILGESGPMTTAELKVAMGDYYNTSTIVTRLYAEGTVKAIGWLPGYPRTGFAGVWAHIDHPSPAVPRPKARVAA